MIKLNGTLILFIFIVVDYFLLIYTNIKIMKGRKLENGKLEDSLT